MISNKIIQAYNKQLQNINEAFQNEIDSFEIDFETPIQRFYIFITDIKYDVVIVKYANQYKYEFRLFTTNEDIKLVYSSVFKFDEITGKSKIIETIKLLELL